MVSPNSSRDVANSGSMEDKEKRLYKTAPSRQAASSEAESESDSDNSSPHASRSPQRKSQPPSRNVASSSKPSVTKRPRDEEQSRGLEKNKKLKEVKKPPPPEAPKQNYKKTSEQKKKVKKSDPSPKSAKKNGQVWDTWDEIGFLKGVATYQETKGLPKNALAPVYDYIRKDKLLRNEYTNVQMYDKLRRLRRKFGGLKEKINAGDYKFKTPHDEALYKLCRKIWASGEEEEEEEEEASMDEEDEKNGDEGAEEDEQKIKEQDVEMTQNDNEEEQEDEDEDEEEDEGEDEDEGEAIDRKGNLASNSVQKQSNVRKNRKSYFVSDVVISTLIDVLRKDHLAEMKDLNGQIMEKVREALRSSVSAGTSDSVQFSSEEVIKRISSSRELPALSKEQAESLKNKWHTQTLIELDTTHKHLLLLEEECQLRMEKLRSEIEQ